MNYSRSRGETDWILGQQLYESEGQRRRKGAQRGVKGRDMEPGKEGRVSDLDLHGPAEALLIRDRAELTGERTAPPLMMADKVGVGGDAGAGWSAHLHCELSLMGK